MPTLGDDERGHLTATRRHVGEAGRAQPRQKAAHAAAEQIRRDVDQHVPHRDVPGRVELRKHLAPDRDPLLHDPGARRDRASAACEHIVPLRRRTSPSRATTPVPPYSSLGLRTRRSRSRRATSSRPIGGRPARSATSATSRVHGTCARIDVELAGREQAGVRRVGQHREECLLVRHLAAERVGDADRAGRVRVDQRRHSSGRPTMSLMRTRR